MVELLGTAGSSTPDEPRRKPRWSDVPWRTIVASVGTVVAAIAAMALLSLTFRLVIWVVVAGFFSIVLAPAVARIERHVHRRSVATAIVMFSTALLVLGTLTVLAWPVRQQAISAATDLPGTVDSAVSGKGSVGQAVERLHLQTFVRDHKADLDRWAEDLSGSSFSIARRVVETLIAVVTVFVLTFLFLTQSAAMGPAALSVIPERRRPAARRAAKDAAAAISGYMIGNLIISVVAGTTALACLAVLGVPNAIVLALWVAFADLIPLVGATIGAAVAVMAAFLHSPTAGFVAIAFFVIYQQVENNVLQPMVMSRTVKVNPLVVILSVLIGVQLFGFAGAVLAIPFAGALQVGVKAARHEYYEDQLRITDES